MSALAGPTVTVKRCSHAGSTTESPNVARGAGPVAAKRTGEGRHSAAVRKEKVLIGRIISREHKRPARMRTEQLRAGRPRSQSVLMAVSRLADDGSLATALSSSTALSPGREP